MPTPVIPIGTRYSEIFSDPNAHWVPIEDDSPDRYSPIDPSLCPFHGDHSCENDGGACGYNAFIFRGDSVACTGPLTVYRNSDNGTTSIGYASYFHNGNNYPSTSNRAAISL